MMRPFLLIGVMAVALSACDEPEPQEYGPNPTLPEPKRGLLPAMTVPRPAEWGDQLPTVPDGYTIRPIATGLRIPRQTLLLPNGDILVAEGSGGYAPPLRPKDFVAGFIKSLGDSSVEGGDRLTLLRDEDGDGTYEQQGVFADNLNAPYGLALVDGSLYVANQDALVRFDYSEGQEVASGPPETVVELPAVINHHWTKAMTAGPDGRFLYVGIGSNSNITERGMDAEEDRAMIWQIDIETGMHRQFATGLRNPTALAIQPGTGELWAVVNERDEIGPNLVPDYLTSVQDGGFYGWPYSYWGQNVDIRAQPQDPEKVAAAIAPDYALGSHVAALGLDFSTPAMGAAFAEGAFVGEHGSWNRSVPVGYKVVFVPFEDGRPVGDPIDFVSGFLTEDGDTRGRPVGVTVDPDGALIVADDLSNTIWRITPDESQATTIPAGEDAAETVEEDPAPAPEEDTEATIEDDAAPVDGVDTAPAAEDASTPVTDDGTTPPEADDAPPPATDDTMAPEVDEGEATVTDDATTPAPGEDTNPVTDNATLPAADEDAAAPDEGDVAPAAEEDAAPATEEDATPAVEEGAAPAAEEDGNPATDNATLPAADEDAAAPDEGDAAPATEQDAVPAAEEDGTLP